MLSIKEKKEKELARAIIDLRKAQALLKRKRISRETTKELVKELVKAIKALKIAQKRVQKKIKPIPPKPRPPSGYKPKPRPPSGYKPTQRPPSVYKQTKKYWKSRYKRMPISKFPGPKRKTRK